MKNIISKLLIISILFWSISFSYAEESCEYESEIKDCLDANISWTTLAIDPEDDFLCITGNSEDMIYNIILDDKFKIIDKDADDYLTALEEGKAQYFWPKQKETFLTWIDKIEATFWKYGYFYNKYFKSVPEIIKATVACKGSTENWIVKDYFYSSSMIQNLIQKKIDTRKQVAYDILKLNKQIVRWDEKKKYVQQKRTHYDIVSNLFMINIWYLLRILHKWASKTKNPM